MANDAAELLRAVKGRLPLVFLALAAGIGITASRLTDIPTGFVLAAGIAVSIMVLLPFRFPASGIRDGLLVFACAASFFCLYRWAETEAPAKALANQLCDPPRVATVEGIVDGKVSPRGRGSSFRFRVDRLSVGDRRVALTFPVYVILPDGAPRYGDRLLLRGQWRLPERPRNPGAFDVRRWLASEGIFSVLEVYDPVDCHLLGEGQGDPVIAASLRARDWVAGRVALGIEDDEQIAGIIQAMTLGLHAETAEETQRIFRETGAWHLFSVSGLHVGMVLLATWLFLQAVRVPVGPAVVLTLALLAGYCFLTGLKPACIRATVMASLVLTGLLLRRQPAVFNSLGGAALLILFFEPSQWFSPGFQLSFLVVAAIALFALPLQERLRRRFAVDPFIPPALVTRRARTAESLGVGFAASAAVSVAAWIGSTPLIAAYFHGVSLAALPANLLCVPIAFCVVAVAMVSLPAGILIPWLGGVLNNANWLLVKILLAILGSLAAIPGSWISVTPPLPDGVEARVTVFDLQDGGCVVIENGKECLLIDAGAEYAAKSIIHPYLAQRGITRLAGVVATHGDARHVGGIPFLLAELRIGALWVPPVGDRSPSRRDAERAAMDVGIPVEPILRGDRIPRFESIQALYPLAADTGRLSDDRPVILLYESAGATILFLSDAGEQAKRWLLENHPGLQADIVVEGHHATGISRSVGFYRALSAESLVLSDATFPERQSVPRPFLAALERSGIEVFLQSRTGAVRIDMMADGARMRPMLP